MRCDRRGHFDRTPNNESSSLERRAWRHTWTSLIISRLKPLCPKCWITIADPLLTSSILIACLLCYVIAVSDLSLKYSPEMGQRASLLCLVGRCMNTYFATLSENCFSEIWRVASFPFDSTKCIVFTYQKLCYVSRYLAYN